MSEKIFVAHPNGYLIGISIAKFCLWRCLNFWIHTLACWCKTTSCVLSSALCFFPKIGYIMVKKNNLNLFYQVLWLNLFKQSHLFSCTVKPLGFWHTLKNLFWSKQYRNTFINSYFKITIEQLKVLFNSYLKALSVPSATAHMPPTKTKE